MKVRIDPDLCIGDGSCAEICPAVFEMRGDGLAYVKAEPDYMACRETLDQAIEGCPVEAIIVDEP